MKLFDFFPLKNRNSYQYFHAIQYENKSVLFRQYLPNNSSNPTALRAAFALLQKNSNEAEKVA